MTRGFNNANQSAILRLVDRLNPIHCRIEVLRSLKAAPQTQPAGAYLLHEAQAGGAGDGADPGVHLFFVLEEVAKGGLTEDAIDGYLHGAP
jgi:hypothetical protein